MSKMDSTKLKNIYQNLKNHYGSLTEIAKRAKVSKQTVTFVLTGRRKNSLVVTIACEVLVELEQKEAENRSTQTAMLEKIKEFKAVSA